MAQMSLEIAIPAALALGYLLGSVSPSYVLGWVLKGVDIREVNFRNAGVRNVKATLGFWPAVITAVIDVTKGVWAVVLSQAFLGLPDTLVALPVAAAVAGHICPFYLGFRGGKGIATAIGAYIYFTGFQIASGAFPLITFCALLAVALVMYLASHNGDVTGMVTFFFMLVATPLELGWTGISILTVKRQYHRRGRA
jgi:acyl phosphate:glycerol-3-phosphate acyltransferase